MPAGKGSAGPEDSWDPSSRTPSLDKGARVTDPRTPPEQRSKLSPTDVSADVKMLPNLVAVNAGTTAMCLLMLWLGSKTAAVIGRFCQCASVRIYLLSMLGLLHVPANVLAG